MPAPKRQRKVIDSAPKEPAPSSSDAPVADESEFAGLAKQHWLKSTKRKTPIKVKDVVVKEGIWDALQRDGYSTKSLLELESLQTLEGYLWPGFTDAASNYHVLLIVLLVNTKRRERLGTWDLFLDRPDDFSAFFRRVLSLTLDKALAINVRNHLLNFTAYAFQSLDSQVVRKECASLVSIGIWHNISTDDKREARLASNAQLRKVWRAGAKRYEAADDAAKSRLRFDRSWLYTLCLDFIARIYMDDPKEDDLIYCEKFVDFLSDLQSQLLTRRYVNFLLQDLLILPALRLSPVFNDEDNGLLRDLQALLEHYTYFTVDDLTGQQQSQTEAHEGHCKRLANLQRVALTTFKEKLTLLALSNYGSIEKRRELESLLAPLSDEELVQFAAQLGLKTQYPGNLGLSIDRRFIMEAVLSTFERRDTFQEEAQKMSILPTEKDLFEQRLLRTETYSGIHPLQLPKLNLQYLCVGDFLWRSWMLYRSEAYFAIRRDIEDVMSRLKPESKKAGETTFSGFSKMALPIAAPSILEAVPALVGDDVPSVVRAEVAVDLGRLGPSVRAEWESLRPDDTVFLLGVDASRKESSVNGERSQSGAQAAGLVTVRSAQVISMTGSQYRTQRDNRQRFEHQNRDSTRKLQLRLDPISYKGDMDKVAAGKPNIYESLNVIMRRSGRENNFKSILESINSLALTDVPLAPWLQEVFLGYGDPAAASYISLPNRLKSVDYHDTFLDWQHLAESLPGKTIEPDDEMTGSFGPPYVLETVSSAEEVAPPKVGKKRRRDAEDDVLVKAETIKVSTYKPINTGPYPVDAPKLNGVRFTPAQVDAIISGSQPGLTIVVGPPGTGKTDVATQIISNIYHNFPQQKTLLIAHSNQALNQLFAKIVALDIDERHLLRLGRGEEDLDTSSSFSKHGRVESFMENRDRYLEDVTRLAASMGAPGAHGSSAETAGYFDAVYVRPAWTKFTEYCKPENVSPKDIEAAFPFKHYFSNAPQPLINAEGTREEALDIANGCFRHISRIFSELEDVRPFEILRRDKDKANYLLTNEARIIAMTSTHAAMRRGEIALLGFHYDNVVMEEAAQITEVESFIPLTMQKLKDGQTPLQRVVLCGDHLQNSPIIQNLAFREFANLEQSLFARLIRLGVPSIMLDQQGRARPSIAGLYQWRYPRLGDLPHVETGDEFLTANAGFKYDYQFINVPDYHGKGEMEPTPHFIQNLGEAEYAVAMYQYMRLLGYPAEKVTILTTYAGQRALIRDVLAHRCADQEVFGMPKTVSTVDKYQGEQNDHIILSLTRTSRVGYLRDVRRLTVALSRARLGLYILGRRDIFENCHELQPAFDILLSRPDKLSLVTGEMWPTTRLLAQEPGDGREAVMEGVEHLGQYVFEMTNTRMAVDKGLPEAGPAEGVEQLEAIEEDKKGEDREDELEPIEDAAGEAAE